jgi:2'-5' RNA ligase
MDLYQQYSELYHDAVLKIKSGRVEIDSMIDSPLDKRLGLTVAFQPEKNIRQKFFDFIEQLRIIEPEQYYYPVSDMHVTVISLVSCYEGFSLSQISLDDYITIIEKSILNCKKFDINFRGITASPSCIMVQGFYSDTTLEMLRENLRENFRNSGLFQTIDKRYSINTAHSTIARFRKKLNNIDDFLAILDQYRDYDFGTSSIETIALVYNDWYHRKSNTVKLKEFYLKENQIL